MHKLALWLPYKKITTINKNPTNSSKCCTACLYFIKSKQKTNKKNKKPLHRFHQYYGKQTFSPTKHVSNRETKTE